MIVAVFAPAERRTEGIVSKRLVVLAALALIAATHVEAQDQQDQQASQSQQPTQSLADVARQTRKAKEEKEKASGPPKMVVNDDTLVSSSRGSMAFGEPVDSKGPSSDRFANAEKQFQLAEQILDRLDPMDKTTLVHYALMSQDVDFPGRNNWEDKLYAAKQYYVSHCRGLLREARELVANAQALKASGAGENDPRVQDLFHRALQIMHDGSSTDADFQAVVLQGQDMAKQASSH